ARARNKRIGSRTTQKLRDKADKNLAKADKKVEAAKAADRAARARAREEGRLAGIEPEPKPSTRNQPGNAGQSNAFVSPQTGRAVQPETPGVPASSHRLGEGSHPVSPSLADPSKPVPAPVPLVPGVAPQPAAPVLADPSPGVAPVAPADPSVP